MGAGGEGGWSPGRGCQSLRGHHPPQTNFQILGARGAVVEGPCASWLVGSPIFDGNRPCKNSHNYGCGHSFLPPLLPTQTALIMANNCEKTETSVYLGTLSKIRFATFNQYYLQNKCILKPITQTYQHSFTETQLCTGTSSQSEGHSIKWLIWLVCGEPLVRNAVMGYM